MNTVFLQRYAILVCTIRFDFVERTKFTKNSFDIVSENGNSVDATLDFVEATFDFVERIIFDL